MKQINAMEKEIRSFSIDFRADVDTRTIEGVAIPFNTPSPNREGFREVIEAGATEGVIEASDIFMLYNHDRRGGFLARNNKGKGTLKIDTKDDGVHFSFKPGNDNLSQYVWERMERGELNEMSFAFTVSKDTWVKGSDGVFTRTINKFDRLFDFSIVDQSYYGIEDACKCKRFAEVQEEDRKALEEAERRAEEEAKEEEARKEAERQARIEETYKKLREEYLQYLK